MKRICILVMLLALLLAGCGEQEPTTVATISPVSAETAVAVNHETVLPEGKKPPVTAALNSVDDFLASIGSNAEITLKPGRYDLSTASDYGKETSNPYYQWVALGDGYQLIIQNVDNLTIRGSGRENSELVHIERYANVLVFQNCTNLTLEGFTAGHTNGGKCAGGVIQLKNCTQAELTNLGLYGCGTLGLRADSCEDVTLRGSEIYDCSSKGIQADDTDGLRVENCSFYDIGTDQYAAGEIFWLSNCMDVNIRNCDVSDNRVMQVFNCRPSAGIEVRETSFARNRVQLAFFLNDGGGMVMDNCRFEDNEIRRWFQLESGTVLDGIGKSWDEEMLDAWYDPPKETVVDEGLEQVVVSNVNELLSEIAPNREIILKDGTYDLSTLKDYGTGWTNYHYWSEEFDGPALVLTGLDNLVIRSESGDPEKCILSAVPRYADVLKFKGCNGITVSGITAGHTVEPGYCTGGVLYFEDCDNVLVDNCGLYGCGILGVRAELCSAVAVTHCEIYECSQGGISMGNSSRIKIENCSFRDLGGDAMYFYECRDVTVDGEQVSGNARLSY